MSKEYELTAESKEYELTAEDWEEAKNTAIEQIKTHKKQIEIYKSVLRKAKKKLDTSKKKKKKKN